MTLWRSVLAVSVALLLVVGGSAFAGLGPAASLVDSDGDGTYDWSDNCPDVANAKQTDFDGDSAGDECDDDIDDDGILNDLDDCPSTVDADDFDDKGCSSTQRDGDGDGLSDAIDACPSSPVGEEVATDGCADSEVDPSRPWWCNSTGTGSGSGQHGMHIDPAYANMTKGMLSRQDCLTLTDQFQAAIAWAMQWPTLGDAEAAGFAMSVDYVAGMGTHHVVYANFTFDDDFDPYDPEFPGTRMDGVFEFERPEFLMYAGTTDDAELVGFAWFVKMNSTSPPEGFAGDNDWWHRHQTLCFYNATLQVIGEDITDGQCNSYQGTNAHLGDFWMAHAWIIEPWLQQYDVFANHHPCLKDDGPEADPADACWMEAMHGTAEHDS